MITSHHHVATLQPWPHLHRTMPAKQEKNRAAASIKSPAVLDPQSYHHRRRSDRETQPTSPAASNPQLTMPAPPKTQATTVEPSSIPSQHWRRITSLGVSPSRLV
ncbi:hypothetical protein M0R45_002333 [Rubus argutus]|uniref:Uncharacterized protein n=1 Tax=Rubus argutus TaxID=59490 RepID=A0AAW1VI61_RUBAR